MTDSLAQRIFTAHLELSLRYGRKVTMAEFGQLVAAHMNRQAPFSAAAVSRWERGQQTPTPDVIEAIAAISGLDPGWISHGIKSAAPQRSGEFPKFTPGMPRPGSGEGGSGPVPPASTGSGSVAGDPPSKLGVDLDQNPLGEIPFEDPMPRPE